MLHFVVAVVIFTSFCPISVWDAMCWEHALFFVFLRCLPYNWLCTMFIELNSDFTSDVRFVFTGKLFWESWFSSGFSRKKKKGRKIHEQVKMTTKLFLYFCGPIVNYFTLHPTPNWNKGSPKGRWQFSLLEYSFSALRSWWKTCSTGRNCLGVIPSESIDIIRVSLLIKSSTHYFPLH